MTRTPTAPAGSSDPAFAAAVQDGLRTPLAALRATIESLSRELAHTGSADVRLEGALNEVARIARNVQALVDWAEPERLRPLDCSPREIALAAVAALPAPERARVELALVGCEHRALFVDGPLLSRCLRNVLDAALGSTGGPVLLRVEGSGEHTVFAVVDAGPRPSPGTDLLAPFAAHKPGSLGLSLPLVRREVERMGGRFCLEHTARGHTLARIELDRAKEVA